MFIDENEQSVVVKDCKVFFKKMEELKSYLVRLDKNNAIKPKVYPSGCVVKDHNERLIILINHV